LLAFLEGFFVVLVPVVAVVNDPQDLDKPKGGSEATQRRLLVGVDLGHGPSRLPPRQLVASDPRCRQTRPPWSSSHRYLELSRMAGL
jgi:hypothetical protein